MRMLGRTSHGARCWLSPGSGPSRSRAPKTTGYRDLQVVYRRPGRRHHLRDPDPDPGWHLHAGGHMLIMAKRTGLLLSVDEGIKQQPDELLSPTPTAPGGSRAGRLQRHSGSTPSAFWPSRSGTIAQPYIGLGVGHPADGQGVSAAGRSPPRPTGRPPSPPRNRRDHCGFGVVARRRAVPGSSRFMLFGQYQLTSAAAGGQAALGRRRTPSPAGSAISLGDAREDTGGASAD